MCVCSITERPGVGFVTCWTDQLQPAACTGLVIGCAPSETVLDISASDPQLALSWLHTYGMVPPTLIQIGGRLQLAEAEVVSLRSPSTS